MNLNNNERRERIREIADKVGLVDAVLDRLSHSVPYNAHSLRTKSHLPERLVLSILGMLERKGFAKRTGNRWLKVDTRICPCCGQLREKEIEKWLTLLNTTNLRALIRRAPRNQSRTSPLP